MVEEEKPSKSIRFKIGIAMFFASCIAFFALLSLPFWEITTEVKALLTIPLVVVSEGLFWLSSYLLGKELLQKYKRYLNPLNWFRKNKKSPDSDN